MRTTVLLHCSDPDCTNLIYLDEAIKGSDIGPDYHGRFCPQCARDRGYWTEFDLAMFEYYLRDSGLLSRTDPKPKKIPMAPQMERLWLD